MQKKVDFFRVGWNKIAPLVVYFCEAAREAIPLSGWATSADMAALAGSHFYFIGQLASLITIIGTKKPFVLSIRLLRPLLKISVIAFYYPVSLPAL